MKFKWDTLVLLFLIVILFSPIVEALTYNQVSSNSTQTIINIPNYYVDNNNSDIDSNMDKGTHSNFSAQQFGPDSVIDNLVEENVATSSVEFLYINESDGTRNDWTMIGASPYLDSIDYNSNYVYASKNNYESGNFGFEDSGKSSEVIERVAIQLYAQQSDTNNPLEVFVWDGSSWTNLGIHEILNGWDWVNWEATEVLNTWTKIDDAKIYIKTATGAGIFEVDCGRLMVEFSGQANYNLDLEVQWVGIDFNEANEELCIYVNNTSNENLQVDVWNGSNWQNVIENLNEGWNNSTITSYLISSLFTIRFYGNIEIDDSIQDSWAIDVTLLHVWT